MGVLLVNLITSSLISESHSSSTALTMKSFMNWTTQAHTSCSKIFALCYASYFSLTLWSYEAAYGQFPVWIVIVNSTPPSNTVTYFYLFITINAWSYPPRLPRLLHLQLFFNYFLRFVNDWSVGWPWIIVTVFSRNDYLISCFDSIFFLFRCPLSY